MTSLNHNITSNTFGKKFPTVMIDLIEIEDKPSDSTGFRPDRDVIFNIFLSISFTKPSHIQSGTFRKIVMTQMKDLTLYANVAHDKFEFLGDSTAVTPNGPTPDYLQEDLENSLFSIGHWLTTASSAFGADGELNPGPSLHKKIPIGNLVIPDNEYGSDLVQNSHFDSNGNEIITISNIKLVFDYQVYRSGAGFGFGDYEIRKKLTVANIIFFAFVGLDESIVFEDDDESNIGRGNMSQNMYFGDISYYHILDKNKVPSKFYQAYIDPSGVPFYGPVLQSVNGKFYAADEYTFENIKAGVEDMISDFSDNRTADPVLDNNIKTLELIINSTSNKVGVLGEMANYRSTYPNKEPSTLSGEFYNRFIIAYQQILSSVESQPELSTKLLYDSLTVDKRFGLLKSEYVGGTTVDESNIVSGIPYTVASSCFIPSKWFMLSRNARIATNTYEPAEFERVYGPADGTGTGLSRSEFEDKLSELNTNEAAFADAVDRYIDEGLSREIALTLATEQLEYAVDNSDKSHYDLFTDSNIYDSVITGDQVVENKGIFFFEFEKALRTKSILSKIFDIGLMQQLFRYRPGFKDFYTELVELSRNELRLSLTEEEIDSIHDDKTYIRSKIRTAFYRHSPLMAQFCRINQHGGVGTDTGADTEEIFIERLQHMRPQIAVASGDSSSRIKAELQSFNFDLPIADPKQRLEEHNMLDNAADLSSLPSSDSRVFDGYRLQAFKFTDIMDDDVAYYNTVGAATETVNGVDASERIKSIKASNVLNGTGVERTCYSVVVQVVDKTANSYIDFCNSILRTYNDFTLYFNKSIEICSFNNLTNSFNDFFVNAISDEFPNKIWVEAAYVATALSKLIFTESSSVNMNNLMSQVMETAIKISPETGNLPQLQEFMIKFNSLIGYIFGYGYVPDLGAQPAPGTDTPYNRYTDLGGDGGHPRLQFYNEKEIWEPIAGSVFPDYLNIDPSLYVSGPILPAVLTTSTGGILAGTPTQSNSDVVKKAPYRPSEGWNKLADPSLQDTIRSAYEIIFWPLSDEDIRYKFFHLRPDDLALRDFGDFGDLNFDEGMSKIINYDPKKLDESGTYSSKSMMQYWIEKIVRRTTIDVELDPESSMRGRRRTEEASIVDRRINRNLWNVYKAIMLFRDEAYRRANISTRDDTQYNLSVKAVQDENDYDRSMLKLPFLSAADDVWAGDDAIAQLNIRIHQLLNFMANHIQEFYLSDLVSAGATRTPTEAHEYFYGSIETTGATLESDRAADYARFVSENLPFANFYFSADADDSLLGDDPVRPLAIRIGTGTASPEGRSYPVTFAGSYRDTFTSALNYMSYVPEFIADSEEEYGIQLIDPEESFFFDFFEHSDFYGTGVGRTAGEALLDLIDMYNSFIIDYPPILFSSTGGFDLGAYMRLMNASFVESLNFGNMVGDWGSVSFEGEPGTGTGVAPIDVFDRG